MQPENNSPKVEEPIVPEINTNPMAPEQPTQPTEQILPTEQLAQPVQPMTANPVVSASVPAAVPQPMPKKPKVPLKVLIVKYKKLLLISLGAITLIIISIVLFNIFYDPTKLSWDSSAADNGVSYTAAKSLDLKVLALDKDNKPINNIKYNVEGGDVKADSVNATWTLPSETGAYKITAIAPSGKKIEKIVKVIRLDDLAGVVIPAKSDDPNLDSDKDGLIDTKEAEIKTDPNLMDTDSDGLIDGYEVNVSKTSPIEKDIDGDGIVDGDELDLSLDPTKADSKGDGIKDSDRTLNYTVSDSKNGVDLNITGKGNIASSTIDKYIDPTFTNMDGVLDSVYNFYSTGTVEKATATVSYTDEAIKTKELNEDGLGLYLFDKDSKKLELVPTVVNKDKNTLTSEITKPSRYVIGDKSVVTSYENQIMLLLDNSLSMYSKKQLEAFGKDSLVSDTKDMANDVNFKRISLSNQLIDNLTGNYKFGAGQFSGDYTNISDITDDKNAIKNGISSIKNDMKNWTSGTNIYGALSSGISKFKKADGNNHYIILLTDGNDNNGALKYMKKTIIDNAKDKNISICVIGLGSSIDPSVLKEISAGTGCGYYDAANDSVLDVVYKKVGSAINHNLVDTNSDNSDDGIIEYDSGFVTARDGFPFGNFSSSNSDGGNCYGMSAFAMLNYTKKLPVKLEDTISSYDKSEVDGYNLDNSYFAKSGKLLDSNLYGYKINDENLSLYLGTPKDYRNRVEGDTLFINKTYLEKFNNIGISIRIKENKGDVSKLPEVVKYQSALLDVKSAKYLQEVDLNDQELLKAIYRLFVLQFDDKESPFGSSPDQSYSELINNLSSKNPVIITIIPESLIDIIKDPNSGHAVNAVKLIRNLDNANKLKIEIYDNNHPGEPRYIEVERTKLNKLSIDYTAWTNEYSYRFKYNNEYKNLKLSYPVIK